MRSPLPGETAPVDLDADLLPLDGLPPRYTALARLAEGGMGLIYRARDGLLRSTVVLKVCRPEVAARPAGRQRFLDEARLTAQLHHPGIVAVHDLGELPDGTPFFTMEEVRGQTFEALISGPADTPEALARRVEAFREAVDAVAYAHGRGVIHRDLKPANLMISELGDVRVMDWGLARPIGQVEAEEGIDLGPREGDGTQLGDILGTPAYMAPEQAMGRLNQIGPAADIYALGAVLYALLAGCPPYVGPTIEVVIAVLRGPPPPLDRGRIPPDLCDICERAMARDRLDRHLDASELAEAVARWMDGATRRAEALAIVARARSALGEIDALRDREAALRAEADRILDGVAPTDPVSASFPAWRLQDEAARVAQDLALREVTWHQELRAALHRDPELPEAHALLAQHYRDALDRAELEREPLAIARAEALLGIHDRGVHRRFLVGDGALDLVTTRPVLARLHRYVEQDRRLVAVFERDLGPTPLVEVPIPHGSWLVTLHGDGPVVRYPVHIARAARWDGVPPEGGAPVPIWIPGPGELAEDEVYVPAGWCIVGGDPQAADTLPRQDVWVDGFVMGRFPVTVGTYARFLQSLLDAGDEPGFEDCLAWVRRPDSTFMRQERRIMTQLGLDPHLPVCAMSFEGACRAAAWLGGRLPNELELEKAARGVDGRTTPWGRQLEARWSRVFGSGPSPAGLLPVGAFPEDEGPYGVRDLAGNARSWCRNWWSRGGPIQGRRAVDTPETGTHRANRGGFHSSPPATQRMATRFGTPPELRLDGVGLRVVRAAPLVSVRPPAT